MKLSKAWNNKIKKRNRLIEGNGKGTWICWKKVSICLHSVHWVFDCQIMGNVLICFDLFMFVLICLCLFWFVYICLDLWGIFGICLDLLGFVWICLDVFRQTVDVLICLGMFRCVWICFHMFGYVLSFKNYKCLY